MLGAGVDVDVSRDSRSVGELESKDVENGRVGERSQVESGRLFVANTANGSDHWGGLSAGRDVVVVVVGRLKVDDRFGGDVGFPKTSQRHAHVVESIRLARAPSVAGAFLVLLKRFWKKEGVPGKEGVKVWFDSVALLSLSTADMVAFVRPDVRVSVNENDPRSFWRVVTRKLVGEKSLHHLFMAC